MKLVKGMIVKLDYETMIKDYTKEFTEKVTKGCLRILDRNALSYHTEVIPPFTFLDINYKDIYLPKWVFKNAKVITMKPFIYLKKEGK